MNLYSQAILLWYMRDCGLLICIQLMCPIKVRLVQQPKTLQFERISHPFLFQSIQAWQAEGIPVSSVEVTEDKEDIEKMKENNS